MKNIPALLLMFIFVNLAKAQNVNFFNGTFQQAKEKSALEIKPLMVYITAVWCGYCKYTENVVFKQDTAYDYFNENYICVKLDEKSKEAKQLKREYMVEVLPAYIFFDSKGKCIRHYDGFLCADKLKTEAIKAKNKKKKIFDLN
jgi:thiol:disulfide interchange protein